ncbi:hypothetical protein FB451DRAFT_1169536 [Mycena latifolia]|nr:hypothetical protein FB451DRAFT_1169536 [Mycena latifolia]
MQSRLWHRETSEERRCFMKSQSFGGTRRASHRYDPSPSQIIPASKIADKNQFRNGTQSHCHSCLGDLVMTDSHDCATLRSSRRDNCKIGGGLSIGDETRSNPTFGFEALSAFSKVHWSSASNGGGAGTTLLGPETENSWQLLKLVLALHLCVPRIITHVSSLPRQKECQIFPNAWPDWFTAPNLGPFMLIMEDSKGYHHSRCGLRVDGQSSRPNHTIRALSRAVGRGIVYEPANSLPRHRVSYATVCEEYAKPLRGQHNMTYVHRRRNGSNTSRGIYTKPEDGHKNLGPVTSGCTHGTCRLPLHLCELNYAQVDAALHPYQVLHTVTPARLARHIREARHSNKMFGRALP